MSSDPPFPPPPSTHPRLIFPPPNLNPLLPAPPVQQSGRSNWHSQNWIGGVGSLYQTSTYPPPLPPRPPCLPDSQRHSVPVVQSNEPTRRSVEMEKAIRRLREKKKAENPMRALNECEKKVVENTQVVSSGGKGLGSTSGANIRGRRLASIDPLRRPTKFVCKMKFWNELPDPTDQPKLINRPNMSYDRFTKYRNASLEKQQRPELYVEPDLGIPLDLLDLSVLNPPEGISLSLDPEDEKLLCEDDCVTPVKKGGLKKKERPDVSGINWLLKSEHRSSVTMPREKKPLPTTNLAPFKKRPIRNYEVEDLPEPSRVSTVLEPMVCSGAGKSVDNSSLQGTVMQDSSIINHSAGSSECNKTRPKRTRKKPAYLADYEL